MAEDELLDAATLKRRAAECRMLPITLADRAEFGRALVLQGYAPERAAEMVGGVILDNDGALQMLARHRVAFGDERRGPMSGAEVHIVRGEANSHVFDDIIRLSSGESIAFADEPWSSRIVAALSLTEATGWIVGSGDGKRFRTWRDGMSDWTDNREEATRYARREDAEAVHREDEDAWTITPYSSGEIEGAEDRLARFFREERPDLGFEGDCEGWSPIEAAMQFLRRRTAA